MKTIQLKITHKELLTLAEKEGGIIGGLTASTGAMNNLTHWVWKPCLKWEKSNKR